MALYPDENFPLRVVEELRRLGHDVLTALEDSRANQSIADHDLLARATEVNRALLTLNRLDSKGYTDRYPTTRESSSAPKTLIVSDKPNALTLLLPRRANSEDG
jgi:hypothetical protein